MEPGRIELSQKVTKRLKVALTIAGTDTLPARTPYGVEPILRRLDSGEQTISTESLIEGIVVFRRLYELTLDPRWEERLNSARQALLGSKDRISPVFFKKEVGLTVDTRVVNPTTGTVVFSRTPEQFVQLSLPRLPEDFSAIELRSDRVSTFKEDTLSVEIGLRVAGFVQVRLQLKNGLDYTFLLAVQENDVQVREISLQSFCFWGQKTFWRPPQAGDRDFGATGTVEIAAANSIVDTKLLPTIAIALKANFDFAIYRIRKEIGTIPPKIAYSLTGSPIFLQLEDGSGIQWKAQLQPTEGSFLVRQFTWSDFSTLNSGIRPDTTRPIRQIEFVGGREASVLNLAYIGEPPTFLGEEGEIVQLGVGTFAVETVEQVLWIGGVRIIDRLQKKEGILPLELEVKLGVIQPGRGAVPAWYRQPLFWRQSGEPGIVQSIYQSLDLLDIPEWSQRINLIQNVAKDWAAQRDNEIAQSIVMKFIVDLGLAPPAFWQSYAASILAIALLANLAGGDRSLTFKTVVKSFNLITASDSSIDEIPQRLKALSLLRESRDNIFYPLPSDLGDKTSSYRSKMLSYLAFDRPIQLPRESSYGARFRVPVRTKRL